MCVCVCVCCVCAVCLMEIRRAMACHMTSRVTKREGVDGQVA